MTDFPAAGYVSSTARTKGEQKTAWEDIVAAAKQLAGGGAESTLTLVSDTVTATGSTHSIDTEGAAATDDLKNIMQTNHPDGRYLFIRSVSSARVVVVKHSAGGAGQISLATGGDVSLRDPKQWLLLKRTGALWEEVLRSPSLMFGTTEESGFIAESDKSAPDRVRRTRYLPTGHGRLSYVSATQIKFAPLNGNLVPVKDANGWRMRTIPSAAVLSGNPTTASNYVDGVANQILAVNTTYEVYLFDAAGILVFDFRTPGHAADADTGVEIKTGNATRTFLGTARTNASSQFESAQRIVSWFNREAFPVGAVFISIFGTDPAELLGYGTWAAFGSGRVLVGQDTGDADFDVLEETGGSKTNTHTHGTNGSGDLAAAGTRSPETTIISIVQPYIVVKMWKRTA